MTSNAWMPRSLPRWRGKIRDLLVELLRPVWRPPRPNLGVVELTIALHRVFDSPARPRSSSTPATRPTCTRCSPAAPDGFDTLRQRGRPVRLPEPGRVRARLVENSHASTALSYADGLAKAYAAARRADRTWSR